MSLVAKFMKMFGHGSQGKHCFFLFYWGGGGLVSGGELRCCYVTGTPSFNVSDRLPFCFAIFIVRPPVPFKFVLKM